MTAQNQNGAEPFGRKLRRLREQREISLERFAQLTVDHDPDGKGLTFGYVGQLERGTQRPNVKRMEFFADLLGIEPTEFIEYKLAMARRELDERAVPLEQAARTLDQTQAALRAMALEEEAKEAERLARDAQRRRQARRRKTSGGKDEPPQPS